MEQDNQRKWRAYSSPVIELEAEEAEAKRREDLEEGRPPLDYSLGDLLSPDLQDTLPLLLDLVELVPSLNPFKLQEEATPGEVAELYVTARSRAFLSRRAAKLERLWREDRRGEGRRGGDYMDPDQ